MKHSLKKKLLFILLSSFILPFTGRSQTMPRLLIAGDYPDPSILREGNDYYMTHSSFIYYPGLLIWHSTDMVNWKPLTRALNYYDGGSVYAPDLVKHKGRYYIYYPANGVNYVVWADHIEGP